MILDLLGLFGFFYCFLLFQTIFYWIFVLNSFSQHSPYKLGSCTSQPQPQDSELPSKSKGGLKDMRTNKLADTEITWSHSHWLPKQTHPSFSLHFLDSKGRFPIVVFPGYSNFKVLAFLYHIKKKNQWLILAVMLPVWNWKFLHFKETFLMRKARWF